MQLKTPHWSKWLIISDVTLKEATSLSLDVDPDALQRVGDEVLVVNREWQEYRERLEILRRVSGPGGPMPLRKGSLGNTVTISLHGFVAWAQDVNWNLPSELLAIASEPSREDLKAQIAELTSELRKAQTSRWAWGSHTTKLLDDLAAAGEKFWKHYDPGNPSMAPTNEQVQSWLTKERKVAARVAEVMAQILRAESVPKGPRPPKSEKTSHPLKA